MIIIWVKKFQSIRVDVKLFFLQSRELNIIFISDFDKIRYIKEKVFLKKFLGDYKQNYKDNINFLKDCR